MSNQEWYYEKDGSQQGPVSGDGLQQLISSGSIPRSTVVWREGLTNWTPYDQSELCSNPYSPPATPVGGPLAPPQPFVARNARLKGDFNFGVFESLSSGWQTMVRDFWPFVGFGALAYIIYGVASNLLIPILVGTFPMLGGYMYYTLKRVRNQPADIEVIFDGYKRRIGSTALLSFLVILPWIVGMVVIFGGLAFFAATPEKVEANPIPAIVFGVAGTLLMVIISTVITIVCSLATLLCLDCDIGWSKAFGLANKAFFKRMFKFIGFAIVTSILGFVGMLALFVGSFVTGAWTVAAFSHIYEEAFGD